MSTFASAEVAGFHVPSDLAERDQWLLWRSERATKVPYAITGRRASSTDPATWGTFDEALAAWQKRPRYWAGIGFVFHESDPFVGIDLDDCLVPDGGDVKVWARGLIERFADTYMEISPSGRGLKIWARGSLPANLGKVTIGDAGVEMYDHARYFAVTGRAFRGAPLEVNDHAADVRALFEHLTRGRQSYRVAAGGRIRYGTQHLSLVSIAGTLRRRNVCEEAIEACLHAINRHQCERPGPPENISRIVRSTERWVQ